MYPWENILTKNNFNDFSILEGDLLVCQASFTTSDPVTLPSSQLSSAKLLGSQPSTVVIILEMFVFSHKLSPFPTSIRFTCMAIKTSTPKHWFSNKALGRLIKRQTPAFLIEQIFNGLENFLAFSQVPRWCQCCWCRDHTLITAQRALLLPRTCHYWWCFKKQNYVLKHSLFFFFLFFFNL